MVRKTWFESQNDDQIKFYYEMNTQWKQFQKDWSENQNIGI